MQQQKRSAVSPTPRPGANTVTSSQQKQQPTVQQQQQWLESSVQTTHNSINDYTTSSIDYTPEVRDQPNTVNTNSQNSTPTTLVQLRSALDDSYQREQNAKDALAKSDSVILELRSTVRQLKRQVDSNSVQGDGASVRSGQTGGADVQELQLQLDRAHAQILTADMVRKELEDTLEAEQYTWELRVQDQERTIAQLQQDCAEFARQAERQEALLTQQGKNSTSTGSGTNDGQVAALQERLQLMEAERTELQSCLDEALKELEAVDAELQNDGKEGEQRQLQQALADWYTMLCRRSRTLPIVQPEQATTSDLVIALQQHVEEYVMKNPNSTGGGLGGGGNDSNLLQETQKQVQDLEKQINVYRGDLKAREESSSELRASLKEAVALLKPLQDTVAKADQEKKQLMDQIHRLQSGIGGASSGTTDSHVEIKKLKRILEDKEMEVDDLQERLQKMELELSRTKLEMANHVMATQQRSFDSGASPATSSKREEIQNKRQAALQQLLKSTQERFETLQAHNDEMEAKNSSLEQRLMSGIDDGALKESLKDKEARVNELESESKHLRNEVARKEQEIESLKREAHSRSMDSGSFQQVASRDGIAQDQQIKDLQTQLASTANQLESKKQVEKALNKSLKEALGLLKPLQQHLEEAEHEKRTMARELRSLRRTSNGSSAGKGGNTRDLESTVRHLEQENSQLHEALEDLSQKSMNVSNLSGITGSSSKADSRMREQLVELKSRYEVTRTKLDEANSENRRLRSGTLSRVQGESSMEEEIQMLRDELAGSRMELENAKYIATSALVQVEEMNQRRHGGSRHEVGRDALYMEKAQQLESEMAGARHQRGRIG